VLACVIINLTPNLHSTQRDYTTYIESILNITSASNLLLFPRASELCALILILLPITNKKLQKVLFPVNLGSSINISSSKVLIVCSCLLLFYSFLPFVQPSKLPPLLVSYPLSSCSTSEELLMCKIAERSFLPYVIYRRSELDNAELYYRRILLLDKH
jgi:hypothetical protein